MFKTTLAAAALACAALATNAQAGTITVSGPPGCSGVFCVNTASLTATSAAGATTSPFQLANFGNSGTNGLVSTAPIAFQGGTITFAPNASTPQAGLYAGNVSNVARSPFDGTGLPASNYLVAEPNDPVNINFNAVRKSFSLLWGTVDSYNSLNVDFLFLGAKVGNLTVTGSQVAQAIGGGFAADGSTPAFVTLSNYSGLFGALPGFDQVVLTSTSSAFEFEPSLAVPEPASIALLGMGLASLGLVRRKTTRNG